jgi:uncharacterized membrane protein
MDQACAGDQPVSSPPAAGLAEWTATVPWLERPARVLADFSARQQGPLADLARGKPLGHPLHPALTDLPIGFWTSSMLLDLVGGRRAAAAARRLVAAGVVTALPTLVAGLADLPTLPESKRRTAAAHAITNVTATALYLKSWRARRRHRLVGIAIGVAAAAAATLGGYLGGWLAFGDEPSAAANPRARSTARSHVA